MNTYAITIKTTQYRTVMVEADDEQGATDTLQGESDYISEDESYEQEYTSIEKVQD